MSNEQSAGFEALLGHSLFEGIMSRRTHRVSLGASVRAGTMSYESQHAPEPLSELEEAILIAVSGCTGLVMPDRPFEDPVSGDLVMAKPNLTMHGRSAGSPDNAQGTHFFLINDNGTYFLRNLPPLPPQPLTPELLVARAREAKVQVLNRRLDVPGSRDFPAYLDSNRLLSNLAGTTILFPVVDLSHQYINGLMYLLTQPEGARPVLVDDRNFYRSAGVSKWVKSGFLNKDLKLPLSTVGTLRTQIEADLLLQNLMLVADGMGLGAWIHAAIGPPVLLGDPKFRQQYGTMLGFEFVTPKWRLWDAIRWHVPLPRYAELRAHPIGLELGEQALIQAKCPPYYATMSDAVDAVVKDKFGEGGVYTDKALFQKIFKKDFGERYLKEAEQYSQQVIDCTRDICAYIYETHGRFPAHCDAIHVPGVWLQVHHCEIDYYKTYFRHGLTEAHERHHQKWHGKPAAAPKP